MAVSPDWETIVIAHEERLGGFFLEAWDAKTGKSKRKFIADGLSFPNSISISPNGRLVASNGVRGEISIWNIQTGELKHILNEGYKFTESLTFSPDGQMLARGTDEGEVNLWDVGDAQ